MKTFVNILGGLYLVVGTFVSLISSGENSLPGAICGAALMAVGMTIFIINKK